MSGATTTTILDTAQPINGTQYPPQIEGLPADADLVTITTGGNDLRFLGSMLYSAWARCDPAGDVTRLLEPMFTEGIREPATSEVEAAVDGLVRIVAAARARTPGARVLLVDYLTVVTEDPAPADGLFSPAELVVFRNTQAVLATCFSMAADRSGAELLAISAVSTKHGLGSAHPWVFGFEADPAKTARSFHPNEDGMAAVAWEVEKLVTTSE